MLCALIMAGGKGERFWPLSTDKKPKQFLKLLGNYTMIQMTVNRLVNLIPIERIFVVTAKRYVNLVREQLPFLPQKNIIVEPIGKNTAPCIALSTFIINKYYKDATIAVFPSDHLIVKEEEFEYTIKSAYEFLKQNSNSIVTIGMKPDRPEIGYGYIKYDKISSTLNGCEIRSVSRFVEKPDLDTAKKYLSEGNFLWNSGIFVWKVSTILNLFHKYLKNTYEILSEIAITDGGSFDEELEEKYKFVDNISIDYGIMEKADNIYVISADIGWDDVGTWKAVERIREKDQNNNICLGDIRNVDSTNNLIIGSKKPIIIAGLDNIFVVETDDVIYIGSKKSIENIKSIKNKLA